MSPEQCRNKQEYSIIYEKLLTAVREINHEETLRCPKCSFRTLPILMDRKKRHFGACSRTKHAMCFNTWFLTLAHIAYAYVFERKDGRREELEMLSDIIDSRYILMDLSRTIDEYIALRGGDQEQ